MLHGLLFPCCFYRRGPTTTKPSAYRHFSLFSTASDAGAHLANYTTFCAFVAADGGPQGPHSLEADVVETGRRVLTASPAGIGCDGCHRGAETRPGCALGVPGVRGRGLLLTTGSRLDSTVPFVVKPQRLRSLTTMGGRAGLWPEGHAQ